MNDSTYDPLFRRHMLLGWWALLTFLSMGAALELLHALKVGLYLVLLGVAIYWGLFGNWIDAWDALLWLSAFAIIDLNTFGLRE